LQRDCLPVVLRDLVDVSHVQSSSRPIFTHGSRDGPTNV
jgi:hypothetical protein